MGMAHALSLELEYAHDWSKEVLHLAASDTNLHTYCLLRCFVGAQAGATVPGLNIDTLGPG